jgi:hypothetical protein
MDDKIIELTKLLEEEPISGISPKELDMLISRHSSPWQSQSRTFWDRFKVIGLLGLILVVAVMAVPALSGQSSADPTAEPANTAEKIAQAEDDLAVNDKEVTAGANKSNEPAKGNPGEDKPQSQTAISVTSQESLASAISLIDSILAEPVDSFELTELE